MPLARAATQGAPSVRPRPAAGPASGASASASASGTGTGASASASIGTSSAAASGAGASAAGGASGYRELTWRHLVPMGWDPMKKFRGMNLDRLGDANPRIIELMDEMRAEFDNAPLVETLDGDAVKLPGYVVPLQSDKEGLREFLLVPYFGACIHTPPPPANQIVHVRLARPAQNVRAMDTVWTSGVMRLERVATEMGMSGYRLDAAQVAPYREGRR
ncbi:hypothetical protein CDN99_21490 [Roseateles aquatilis]|uniref:DUF3299 domain-containing protein n=2 Tax=Roseateles aquatilis TaxID=431061 RepID=A0A246IZK8_9BURK|nr:hypothetical protein CDN99_21490 [Roseateles aquatilis]